MTLRNIPPPLLTVVLAVVAGVTACSPGANYAGSTSITQEPITLPPTTPTTAGTTTTTAPTTTRLSPKEIEAAVRAVHTRFMTELFNRDERIDGPEVILALAEELTSGQQLARIREYVARHVESGERVAGPGFDSNIIEVLVDGDHASVLDCFARQYGVVLGRG